MPKGHSDLPARIDALELEIAALKLTNKAHTSWTEDIALAQKQADALTTELTYRLSQIEIRFKDWREAFNRGNIPQAGLPLTEYKPQFTVWPGANPSSNGS